jgi:hypothetical protein
MKPVVPRSFRCPESGDLCTNGDCTQTLCRAETRALADGARKEAVKASRAATATARWAVAEMIKRLRNSN